MLYFFTGKIMGLSDFLGALHKIGGRIFMHLTPLLRNGCFFSVSPIFLTQHPVMLRDTAGEKVRMFLSCCIETLSDCNEIRNVLYSSSAHECAIGEVSRSDGGVGFYQNLFSCFLIPLRRKLSFFRFLPFNPSPRRYRSSVSPLYFALQNTGEEF